MASFPATLKIPVGQGLQGKNFPDINIYPMGLILKFYLTDFREKFVIWRNFLILLIRKDHVLPTMRLGLSIHLEQKIGKLT